MIDAGTVYKRTELAITDAEMAALTFTELRSLDKTIDHLLRTADVEVEVSRIYWDGTAIRLRRRPKVLTITTM